ncbi:MAG TPA: hypothetical protein VMN36_04470 [Verrucomicrobiales bacterium]|nr:hypothetical protein [Verrucomicrobiales bacterium]
MELHPRDTGVERFFSYWKAIAGFLLFGALTVVVLLAAKGCGAGASFVVSEQERRLDARRETEAAQSALTGPDSWAVDEEKQTARVPVDTAMRALLPAIQNRRQSVTDRPVPGTAPYNEMMEQEAAAAAAAGQPPPPAPGETAPAEGGEQTIEP